MKSFHTHGSADNREYGRSISLTSDVNAPE